MTSSWRLLSVMAAIALPACVLIGGNGDGGGGGTGGSSTVSTCQDDCKQHLFFECIDADKHEQCRAACETASDSDRATFSSCCEGALPNCDQATACVDNFLDIGVADSGSGGGGGGLSAGGGSSSSGNVDGSGGGQGEVTPCAMACEKILASDCGFENPFPTCDDACAALTPTQRDDLVMCAAGQTGCTFPDGCMVDFPMPG